MVERADTDNDGLVSEEEFYNIITKKTFAAWFLFEYSGIIWKCIEYIDITVSIEKYGNDHNLVVFITSLPNLNDWFELSSFLGIWHPFILFLTAPNTVNKLSWIYCFYWWFLLILSRSWQFYFSIKFIYAFRSHIFFSNYLIVPVRWLFCYSELHNCWFNLSNYCYWLFF